MALKEWPNSPLSHPQSSLPPRPHPRTQSQQSWVGSLLGRCTGSCLLCSHTGHRHRAGGYGHIHPRLGQREPVGLRKRLGPIPIAITTLLSIPVWRQPPGLCPGCSLPPRFPINGPSTVARVRPGHHLLHVAFLSQSCPLLKGPTSPSIIQKGR